MTYFAWIAFLSIFFALSFWHIFFTTGQSKQEADAHGHRPKEKAVEKPEVGSLRRLWESVRAARHHLQLPATVLQTSHPPLDGQKGLLFKGSEHNSSLLNLDVGLQKMCWSLYRTNMRCDLCACLDTCASITLHPVCLFSGLQRSAEAESRAEDEAEAEFSLQDHRVDQDDCCLKPIKYNLTCISTSGLS